MVNTRAPGTVQTPTDSVDAFWARNELIPFLMTVFRNRAGYSTWKHSNWERSIKIAEQNIDRIPFYEDFPSTIERLRLSLTNPCVLTPEELTKFSRLADGPVQVVVSIFVRHMICHGKYELHSLGVNPSPDFPRNQESAPDHAKAPDWKETEEVQRRIGALTMKGQSK
ncbi:hypothetical protein BDW02DRAFT_650021 [Decorospora gaudefroyi]|uniref:Uncharacterized protein n=1 Tax=Decorospora gaudefroyi TaxID=184978 RepID=A0A6A5KD15_9PLEO|nr:hypothetical protein BDW02DRAFT_650021 [Decorospora gaudefroyi]